VRTPGSIGNEPYPSFEGTVVPDPLQTHTRFSTEAHELKYVNKRPHKPGRYATRFQSLDISHGLSAAHGSHRSFVDITEYWSFIRMDLTGHHLTQKFTLLHSHRRQGRQRVTRFIMQTSGISDDKYIGIIRDTHVVIYLHSSGAVLHNFH